MNKVKSLIREYEKEKDSIKKLVLVDSIQNELEKTKKELARKVRWDWRKLPHRNPSQGDTEGLQSQDDTGHQK